MMLFFYVVCMIALIVIGWWVTRKKLNPATIYNAIWLIVVLLYQLRLSNLQPELSEQTYWLLMIKSTVFTFGFLLFYRFRLKKNKSLRVEEKGEAVGASNEPEISVAQYKKILVPLFVVWCVVEIFETIYSGGLPIVWKIIGDPRTYFDYGVSTLHGLMNALGLTIITLASLACFKKDAEKRHRTIFISIIAICLLFYLSIFTRQVIVSAIIQMIAVFLLTKRPIRFKKIIVWMLPLAITGIIIFGVIGNVRTGYEGFLSVAGIGASIPPVFVGFYWVYMYITMSLANVNNAVILGVNHFGGLYPAIRNFLPTVFSTTLFADSAVVVPNYLVTKAFNVSGYFIDFYVGLGTLGVAIVAAIYGILGGIIYRILQKKKTERNIVLYAIYLQIIILSFFYNHLFYLPSGFQFIIVLGIYYFLKRRPTYGKK